MFDELSIAIVGARYENPKRKGKPTGNRETEILMMAPGDKVTLEPEPENPADKNAIAAYSPHGVQIGYIVADRTMLIHRAWEAARTVWVIFQQATAYGAIVRVSFDGNVPSLPPAEEPSSLLRHAANPDADEDPGFYPDPIYDD